MLHTPIPVQSNQLPKLAAVLELFKPVTWFAAMWAFMLSSGVHATIAGVLLAFTIPFNKGDDHSPAAHMEHACFLLSLHLSRQCIIITLLHDQDWKFN